MSLIAHLLCLSSFLLLLVLCVRGESAKNNGMEVTPDADSFVPSSAESGSSSKSVESESVQEIVSAIRRAERCHQIDKQNKQDALAALVFTQTSVVQLYKAIVQQSSAAHQCPSDEEVEFVSAVVHAATKMSSNIIIDSLQFRETKSATVAATGTTSKSMTDSAVGQADTESHSFATQSAGNGVTVPVFWAAEIETGSIDWGCTDRRWWIDINGDSIPDYCRAAHGSCSDTVNAHLLCSITGLA